MPAVIEWWLEIPAIIPLVVVGTLTAVFYRFLAGVDKNCLGTDM